MASAMWPPETSKPVAPAVTRWFELSRLAPTPTNTWLIVRSMVSSVASSRSRSVSEKTPFAFWSTSTVRLAKPKPAVPTTTPKRSIAADPLIASSTVRVRPGICGRKWFVSVTVAQSMRWVGAAPVALLTRIVPVTESVRPGMPPRLPLAPTERPV